MKFCTLSLFLALLVAACLPAAAQTDGLRLNIPFNFIVLGKTLPAGHYEVKRALYANNAAWVICGDQVTATAVTHSVESPRMAHALSLVFLKAGDQYSLVQIWDEEHFGRELPRSNVKQTLVAEGGKYVEIGAE
jgi:hypothetical protein